MPTTLQFTKMHGLGNDFIVLDGINQNFDLTPELIQQLASRHKGIGFDQCLIVEPPQDSTSDFYYRIFNADGTEVGQCGNGARCLALFIKENALSKKNEYTVKTFASTLRLRPLSDNEVWVEFDEPDFSPINVPIRYQNKAIHYPFKINKDVYQLHCLNVGNPHGILIVKDLPDDLIQSIGLSLSKHPEFLEGANISFVKINSTQEAILRVYERGCGETHACGSAAIASAACLRLFHSGADKIVMHLPGGSLTINWQGTGHKISFTGSATTVFKGSITL